MNQQENHSQSQEPETKATTRQRRKRIFWLNFMVALLLTIGVGIKIGATIPLISLLITDAGFSRFMVGLNTALYAGMILLTAPFVPFLTRKCGLASTLLVSLFLTVFSCLALAFTHQLWLWFVLRAVMGIASALDWIVGEMWVTTLAQKHNRGRVVTAYAVAFGAGVALGPQILTLLSGDHSDKFIPIALILSIPILPIWLMRKRLPSGYHHHVKGLWHIIKKARSALALALITGVAEASAFALFPLFALAYVHSEATSLLYVTAFAFGGVLLQVPIGILCDFLNRRLLIMITVMLGVSALALLPFVMPGYTALFLSFVWGGTVAALYVQSLVWITADHAGERLALANAAFVMAYTAGMSIGPPIIGQAMDQFGGWGFIAIVGVCYVLALTLLLAKKNL